MIVHTEPSNKCAGHIECHYVRFKGTYNYISVVFQYVAHKASLLD